MGISMNISCICHKHAPNNNNTSRIIVMRDTHRFRGLFREFLELISQILGFSPPQAYKKVENIQQIQDKTNELSCDFETILLVAKDKLTGFLISSWRKQFVV